MGTVFGKTGRAKSPDYQSLSMQAPEPVPIPEPDPEAERVTRRRRRGRPETIITGELEPQTRGTTLLG